MVKENEKINREIPPIKINQGLPVLIKKLIKKDTIEIKPICLSLLGSQKKENQSICNRLGF